MAENEVIRDNPTTVNGLRAIEMRYRPIYDSFTKGAAFYQSSMRLNAPDMGVLLLITPSVTATAPICIIST